MKGLLGVWRGAGSYWLLLVSQSFLSPLRELWSRVRTVILTLCLPLCRPFRKVVSSVARISKWEAALYVPGSVAFQNRFWSRKELRVFFWEGLTSFHATYCELKLRGRTSLGMWYSTWSRRCQGTRFVFLRRYNKKENALRASGCQSVKVSMLRKGNRSWIK